MTIERPMFPPRAEQCTIIDLSKFKRPEPTKGALQAYREGQEAKLEAMVMQLATPEKLSPTAKNLRLRMARKGDWRIARRTTDYWRARMDWEYSLEVAQAYNIADSNEFIKAQRPVHHTLLELWRVALVKQMLTPAPDMAAVHWKQAQFKRGEHRWVAVKPEKIEQAIESDIEWLKAHPTSRREMGGAA